MLHFHWTSEVKDRKPEFGLSFWFYRPSDPSSIGGWIVYRRKDRSYWACHLRYSKTYKYFVKTIIKADAERVRLDEEALADVYK